MIAECGLCGKKRQTVMGYEFYGCLQDCGALCEDCARDVLTLFTASHAVVELIMGRALIDKCEKCAYESARGDCGANPPDCLRALVGDAE